MEFYAYFNKAGRQHAADELERLGLDWDADATCDEIAGKSSFHDLEPGVGDSMDYEISNFEVGKKSYGVFGYIEICADKHVTFEAV